MTEDTAAESVPNRVKVSPYVIDLMYALADARPEGITSVTSVTEMLSLIGDTQRYDIAYEASYFADEADEAEPSALKMHGHAVDSGHLIAIQGREKATLPIYNRLVERFILPGRLGVKFVAFYKNPCRVIIELSSGANSVDLRRILDAILGRPDNPVNVDEPWPPGMPEIDPLSSAGVDLAKCLVSIEARLTSIQDEVTGLATDASGEFTALWGKLSAIEAAVDVILAHVTARGQRAPEATAQGDNATPTQ